MDPKIPTLKDSQKPQVKIRGLEAGVTLFDRLKQFKKKDLAFILAGLGTLFMAPLAEHFMMSPEGGDATLGAGFGGKGSGKGIFDGNGSVSPYETGVNGQAPGSAVGGGSDVITPLNVRDPSALVMGPGATQQPPTNSVAPVTPPPTAPVTRSDSDLKDALAASARGVGAAAHAAKALLPVPKVAIANSGLRGLGVSSGGSSATSSVITSQGLASGKANAGGGGLNMVRAAPNYKGVSARGQSAGGDGLSALKAAANNAGDVMNRGAAATALDAAASQQIPNGGSGAGGLGAGATAGSDKPDSGNQDKNSKSVGESLEFLKQKAMQDAKIALWAKEQEAGDNKLQMLKMRNSIADAIAGKIGGAVGDAITCPITKNAKKCFGPAAPDAGHYLCDAPPPGKGKIDSIDASDVGSSCDGTAKYYVSGDALNTCTNTGGDKSSSNPGSAYGVNCQKFGGDGSSGGGAAGSKPADGKGSVDGAPKTASDMMSSPAVKDLQSACDSLDSMSKTMGDLNDKSRAGEIKNIQDYVQDMKTRAGLVASLRDALNTGKVAKTDCGGKTLPVEKPLIKQQNDVLTAIVNDVPAGTGQEAAGSGLLPQLAKALAVSDPAKPDAAVPAVDPSKLPGSKEIEDNIKLANTDVEKIKSVDPVVPIRNEKTVAKDIASVYGTSFGKLDPSTINGKIKGVTDAAQQINTAMKTVQDAQKVVVAVQKDLNDNAGRLGKTSGPQGTVAQIVPLDDRTMKIVRDPVFKADSFQTSNVAEVKIDGNGKPADGLPNLIKKADTDLKAAETKFQEYKDGKTKTPPSPTLQEANPVVAAGVTSLNNARTNQAGELSSLSSTLKADQAKLAAAKTTPQ